MKIHVFTNGAAIIELPKDMHAEKLDWLLKSWTEGHKIIYTQDEVDVVVYDVPLGAEKHELDEGK